VLALAKPCIELTCLKQHLCRPDFELDHSAILRNDADNSGVYQGVVKSV